MSFPQLLPLLAVLLIGCARSDTAPSDAPRERRVIATDAAPEAIGPYSQAIQVGNTLYCAGQIGLDPGTGALVDGGIKAETRRTLDNLQAVLEAAGFSMKEVVNTQVFLVDLNEYAAMNEVYASYFETAPPARAAIQAARLPRDARVEIMVTAVR